MTKHGMFALFPLLGLLYCAAAAGGESKTFELLDGDRVAFIGDAFFENEKNTGYIETVLTARFPDRNVIFRNLGWGGDNVFGESRAVFGTVKDGFASLAKQVAEIKPTVAFVCYGMNDSFDGEAGLAQFEAGYAALLDMIAKEGAPNLRIALMTPIAHENLGKPLPDPAEHNKQLAIYSESIRKIAAARKLFVFDLFTRTSAVLAAGKHLTRDGIHLTPDGYLRVASLIGSINEKGDGWFSGAENTKGAEYEKLEQMRRTIVAKDAQFFNRWRPQNETYIFLFRKKEQGRNAVEIPQFDPIIAEKEAEIAKLRAPLGRLYVESEGR